MTGFGDTIAAVSTPRGKGGIAVIRVSGPEAVELSDRIFFAASGVKLKDTCPNTAVWGRIREGDEVIDDGIATVFRAPRSFTGEDTVEISCHGGILVTEAVLGSILAAGARAAEAGEFSRRAFVNGKLGLSHAEALASLLDAGNRNQLMLSRSGLEGRIADECRLIYGKLCDLLGNVYAKIDYPDEDLSGLSREALIDGMTEVRGAVETLADTYRSGHAVAEGIRTVICGRPNAGKSSLYNVMVGRDAAIVTDVEGTTRDVLEETVPFGGVTLRLCDTAGLRGGDDIDEVERIGIRRAHERMEEAELILALFDSTRPFDAEDEELALFLATKKDKVIAVMSKCDCGESSARPRIEALLGEAVELSVKTEDGARKLAAAIEARFLDGSLDLRHDPVVASARQHAALTRGLAHIDSALLSLEQGFPEELCAADIESAMQAVGELDARSVSDDIVSNIFSRFCVGK